MERQRTKWLKGKKSGIPGMQFGERVLWKSSDKRRHKMDSDWHDGVFLELRTVCGEYLVGAKEGVFRPRTVRRVPVENRWADYLLRDWSAVEA